MRGLMSLARRPPLLGVIVAAWMGTTWLCVERRHENRDAPDPLHAALQPTPCPSLGGLKTRLLDTDHELVSIVAIDIDGDGDLDIVGNDQALELFVWENDGTGRLTRKYPHLSTGGCLEVPGSAVHDQPTRSEAFSYNHCPPVGMDRRAASFAPNALRLWTASSCHTPPRVGASTRTPRAPPSLRLA